MLIRYLSISTLFSVVYLEDILKPTHFIMRPTANQCGLSSTRHLLRHMCVTSKLTKPNYGLYGNYARYGFDFGGLLLYWLSTTVRESGLLNYLTHSWGEWFFRNWMCWSQPKFWVQSSISRTLLFSNSPSANAPISLS